jgi:hypothetical protein
MLAATKDFEAALLQWITLMTGRRVKKCSVLPGRTRHSGNAESGGADKSPPARLARPWWRYRARCRNLQRRLVDGVSAGGGDEKHKQCRQKRVLRL